MSDTNQDKTARTPRLTIDQNATPAGESADGRFRKTLTITNTSKRTVTWTLSKTDAVSTDPGEWQNEFLPALYDTRVTFSKTKVKVPARGSARVTVTITPDREAPEGTVYSGYVVLTSAEGTTLSVPFAGMAGDYGNLDVFPDLGIVEQDMDLSVVGVQNGGKLVAEGG